MIVFVSTANEYFRCGLITLFKNMKKTELKNIYLIDLECHGVFVFDIYHDEMPLCPYRRVELFSRLLVYKDSAKNFFRSLMQNYNDSDLISKKLLSDRELQVLYLLLSGKRANEISEVLMISVKTVSIYKIRGLNKLGVKNIAVLQMLFRRWYSFREQASLTAANRISAIFPPLSCHNLI